MEEACHPAGPVLKRGQGVLQSGDRQAGDFILSPFIEVLQANVFSFPFLERYIHP